MNKHWPRWIEASVWKHIDTICQANNLTLYREAALNRDEILQLADYTEFRLDGPFIEQMHPKNYYHLEIEVNIAIASKLHLKDIFRMKRNQGIILTALEGPIPIYRYGRGAEDTGTLLGCFTIVPKRDRNDRFVVSNFGRIEPSTPMEQSTVEGHYRMEVTG